MATRGAPKGNTNGEKHGVVTLQNQIKRRRRKGRTLIDRRSTAGRNAVTVKAKLIADLGGEENLSVAKLVILEMIARDVFYLDECDRRIFKAIDRVNAEVRRNKIKLKNPKMIGIMYAYRSGVAKNLASNLALIGLERQMPKPKTLQEILADEQSSAEESAEQSNRDAQGGNGEND
jgi:hypothetical protein